MKKTVIRIAVMIAVFVITVLVTSKIINKDQENLTMDIDSASFPVVTMVYGDFLYNELHGYSSPREICGVANEITVLGENRETGFHIDTFGQTIESIEYEVRSYAGDRLIETGSVEDYKTTGWSIDGFIYLKDLLEIDEQYNLCIKLDVNNEKEVYFYTLVECENDYKLAEKLDFIQYFHDCLFDKEKSKELKKFIETNSSLNDNSSFAYVDIHSSLKQLSYGELEISQLDEPVIRLSQISDLLAEVTVDYYVSTGEAGDKVYYKLKEYFRIKKGNERYLLLDYQRYMEQLPDVRKLCVNDKIVLGIADRDVNYMASEDGKTVAFISAGSLYAYHTQNNKLTRVFAFTGNGELDVRANYDAHEIKILDIDEDANIEFAVYGYMNSGRREGSVGVGVYKFESKLNTIEEIFYIPYERSYGILNAEMSTLLYMNRNNHLYIALENEVYCIDMDTRQFTRRNHIDEDDTLVTSKDHRILISTQLYPDSELSQSLVLTNLKTETDIVIQAISGDAIKSMGFIGNDVIYGVAHIEDIKEESSGRMIFPMYQLVICDEEGRLLKDYEYEGIYVTGIEKKDNQLILDRVTIDADGRIRDTSPDYISTSSISESVSVTDATAIVDIYETYVQLQLPKSVDEKTLKITNPKEIVYEGGRIVDIEPERAERFYVYNAFGLKNIYCLASNSVDLAYSEAGWVYDNSGRIIWERTTRSSKNQIMSITAVEATEEKNSLAVCLDTMLANEGIVRNSDYLLKQGDSALDILEQNLEGCIILNLQECSLETILYYINQDIPVMIMTGSDTAELIVGYNDSKSTIVVMNPDKGVLETLSFDKAIEYFDSCGNNFITYMR